MVTPPTAADIRARSRVPFEDLGWPEPADDREIDLLQEALDAIIPWIEDVTGYYWEPVSATPPQYAVLDRDRARFYRAIRMAAEFEAFKGQPEAVEDMADFAEIAAMSAGSYSETRRTHQQALRAQSLHPWPTLAGLLAQLMHPTRRMRGEAPAVGLSDPLRVPGEDIMNAGRRLYNPYDMRSGAFVAPVTTWTEAP